MIITGFLASVILYLAGIFTYQNPTEKASVTVATRQVITHQLSCYQVRFCGPSLSIWVYMYGAMIIVILWYQSTSISFSFLVPFGYLMDTVPQRVHAVTGSAQLRCNVTVRTALSMHFLWLALLCYSACMTLLHLGPSLKEP